MNDDTQMDLSDMPQNCLCLRDRITGEMIDRYDDTDFDTFIKNQWGGWHPWHKGSEWSQIPCIDYTMYWSNR